MENISSKVLDDGDEALLSKGRKFNTGHSNKDILNIIATIDNEIECDRDIPREEK